LTNIEQHTDQLGRLLTIIDKPQRIISLVPSQTEFLIAIGLKGRLVGITKYCIHPAELVNEIPQIGGTKNPDITKIRALQPDLIIGNKEENRKEDIDDLSKEFPLWLSDIATLEDSYDMMLKLGSICDCKIPSEQIVAEIKSNWATIPYSEIKEVLYFIWRKPYMLAGNDTFINSILQKIGFKNLIDQARYPDMDEVALKKLEPELVLLSSEPYPFKEKHIKEFEKLFPKAEIKIVDGEMFSWFGSRQVLCPDYIKDLKK